MPRKAANHQQSRYEPTFVQSVVTWSHGLACGRRNLGSCRYRERFECGPFAKSNGARRCQIEDRKGFLQTAHSKRRSEFEALAGQRPFDEEKA